MLTAVTKFNYIATVYFFWHCIFGDGEPIKCSEIDADNSKKWYADHLALGPYDINRKYDTYAFNEGEWPSWLINLATPFMAYWD
jgi:hypothetical protein